jgi:hypothetical protein
MQIAEIIDALMSSFSITRAEERLARIRALVASDFLFVNPGFVAEGPEELSAAVGEFMAFLDKGVTIARTSEVELHHDYFRYSWARYRGGQIEMEGCDFGWIGDAGQLKRLVVFDHLGPRRLPIA